MRIVKMKWIVAACAVVLLLGGASVASAIDLSTTGYELLLPMTSTDITTISFDYTNGPFTAGNDRRIRIYGYYDSGSGDEPQWMMPMVFRTTHPSTSEAADWFGVDSDYGWYWYRLGDTGTFTGSHTFEARLDRYRGIVEWRISGINGGAELTFVNQPPDTNSPQPNGYVLDEVLPEPCPNMFFADEEIDPDTGDYYGVAHATELGWIAYAPEYGVGGLGEYYLIFNPGGTGASVDNIKPGIPGDANLDGTVDLLDLGVVGDNWNGTGKDWSTGDFNGDGVCDLLDLGDVGDHWNEVGSISYVPLAAEAAVPEPSTWCLLAGALAMLALWRRKR